MVLICTSLFSQNEQFKVYEDSFDIKSVKVGTYILGNPQKIDYLNLDTFTTEDHQYRIERRLNEPYIGLGNQGSPLRSLVWNTPQSISLDMGINVFDPYFFNVNEIILFQVDRPYTELFISQGKAYENSIFSTQNNMTLEGVFSRNLKYDMNLFIKYRKIKEAGIFQHDENNITAFQTGITRETNDKLWNAALIYTFNEIERQENGGIAAADSTFFEEIKTTRTALETFLRDGYSRSTNYNIQLNNEIRISGNQKNGIYINYNSTWSTSVYKYFDSNIATANDTLYYKDFIVSDKGIRSFLSYNSLKNDVKLSWQSEFIKELSFGASYTKYNIGWDQDKEVENHLQMYGVFNFKIGRLSSSNRLNKGLLDISTTYDIISNTKFELNQLGLLTFDINAIKKKADLIVRRLDISQYQYWKNDWLDQEYAQFKIMYSAPKSYFDIGANHNLIKNHVFFNSISSPTLHHNVVQFQNYFIKSNLMYKYFGLRNEFYYRSKKNIEFIYTPQFHSEHEIYFSHKVINENTLLRTGFEVRYYDNYILPKYNPIIGNFYNGNIDSGNKFILDYYINVKIPQFKIFIKASNLIDLFQSQQYKWADNYPIHDWTIRFGVKWIYIN